MRDSSVRPYVVLRHLWLDGQQSLCGDRGDGFRYFRHYDSPVELLRASASGSARAMWWKVHPTPGANLRGESCDVVAAGLPATIDDPDVVRLVADAIRPQVA